MGRYHRRARTKQPKKTGVPQPAIGQEGIRRLRYVIVFQLLCIIIFTSVCLYQHTQHVDSYCGTAKQPPILIMLGKQINTEYFDDIRRVFHRLGYRRMNTTRNRQDWDLVWSHEDTYSLLEHRRRKFQIVQSPLSHQKVNHVPGNALITSKGHLVREGSNFIPVGFLMPQDKAAFLEEVQKNDTRLWIQKTVAHRGCELREMHDLNLDSEAIIQEFVKNPFLIDGYKFNTGVFVLLTSIDPLRAYILDSAVTLRFTLKKYSHSNFKDTARYITDVDDPRRITKVPSLKKMFMKLAFNRLTAIEAHLQMIGKDSSVIRAQIYDAVRDVLTTREARLRQGIPDGLVDRKNSNFELTRWDFLVDEELKLHLIEVNMSPNLHADLSDLPRVQQMEHIMFNSFRVAGLTDIRKHGLGSSSLNSIRNSDINAGIGICVLSECATCTNKDCFVCSHCMGEEAKQIIRLAFTEHINRQNMRRVYPEGMTQREALDYDIRKDEHLSENDQLTRAWFRAKCIGDPYWCK